MSSVIAFTLGVEWAMAWSRLVELPAESADSLSVHLANADRVVRLAERLGRRAAATPCDAAAGWVSIEVESGLYSPAER